MANVTLNMLYDEIRCLHRDIELLKSVVVPVEKISEVERKELRGIAGEMDAGEKFSAKDVFG